MNDHFAAFSFVDRIIDLEPGMRARGTFAVPGNLAAFPACLVAEAVGHVEMLDVQPAIDHWKAKGLDFTRLFHKPEVPSEVTDASIEADAVAPEEQGPGDSEGEPPAAPDEAEEPS